MGKLKINPFLVPKSNDMNLINSYIHSIDIPAPSFSQTFNNLSEITANGGTVSGNVALLNGTVTFAGGYIVYGQIFSSQPHTVHFENLTYNSAIAYAYLLFAYGNGQYNYSIFQGLTSWFSTKYSNRTQADNVPLSVGTFDFIFTDSIMEIWIDGEFITSFNPAVPNTTQPITYLGSYVGTQYPFYGSFKKFEVYDYVLSGDQMKNLFNNL